jgi:hypothetical protein
MKMKKTSAVLILFLAFITYGNAQTDEKLVVQAFDNYKSAILNDKGEEAVKFVDSRTIAYYNKMIDLIKNGDSTTVNALSVLDKITVFSIRERGTKAEIMPLDGRGLLVFSIKKGMVAKSSMVNNTIGDVTVDKNYAKGALVVKGNATPYNMDFYKEQGQWKADITSLFSIAAPAFKGMIESSGMAENAFIFSILERMTGKKPGPEAWQKVNR